MLKKIPSPLRFIFQTYLWGILFFSFFRIALFLLHYKSAAGIPNEVIARSFLTGLQFDTVVSGYLLALPVLIFFILSFFKNGFRFTSKIIFVYIILFYSLSFLIICADVPWFEHQQTRFTIAAMQWTNTPGMMMQFVFADIRNYPYLIFLVVVIYAFYKAIKRIRNRTLSAEDYSLNRFAVTGIYVVFLFFTFLAIRGRVALKSPIRWGTAFTSEYNLTNQLGLNPVFTFMQSGLEKLNNKNSRINFMENEQAISIVQNYYGIQQTNKASSPIERKIVPDKPASRFNVVLVLMESMSSHNLKHFGGDGNKTPMLDSLLNKSLSFENFYSDGIHTFNGVYSSFFGTPSLPEHHHMKDLNNQQDYSGLARTLSGKGYQTLFFTSHDEQFDNAGGFLAANGFQKIISQKDYKSEEVINALGIPDHILFREVVGNLNEVAKNQKPFFAGVLTASNHGPYEIPSGISFQPQSTDIREQLVEYADWSIGEFIHSCSKQSWFDSTIFLFTGDHGAVLGDRDANVTYHHVPLIVFAPKLFFIAEINQSLGGQIDIFPTVLGLLNLPYSNNTFGIDLLKEKRQFITFSYDESYGAFGLGDYCIFRKGKTDLYKISSDAKNCSVIENKSRMDSMLNFTKAVFQTQQWMIEKRLLK